MTFKEWLLLTYRNRPTVARHVRPIVSGDQPSDRDRRVTASVMRPGHGRLGLVRYMTSIQLNLHYQLNAANGLSAKPDNIGKGIGRKS